MNHNYRRFGLYPVFALLFLTATIAYFSQAVRVVSINGVIEPGSFLIFPLTFFFADIITEVYGYKYLRQLVWINMLCLVFFTLLVSLSMKIPSVHLGDYSVSLTWVFGGYFKLLFSVAVAAWISFFVNGYLLAKLKVLLKGRLYWLRSLLSTSVGEVFFSSIWAVLFYAGILDGHQLFMLIVYMYAYKMIFEIIATPISAGITRWLKRVENLNVFDEKTRFTPFSFK